MPGAWDDRQRGGDPADGRDEIPAGAAAAEELAHEVALAAALDRSRRDLSPDPHASARMRERLFEVLAQEGVGQRFGERPSVEPADPTAPIGPPIGDDLGHNAASSRRSAGEHAPDSDDPRNPARSRPRRGRHVLPADHPDHPAGPGRDARESGAETRPGSRPPERPRPSVRKRFGIVVGGFAALAVVAGVTSTVSRDALPGDGLYGVKRASESMGGVFTVGEQAEAARQLDLARSRVDEIENLMARSSSPSPDALADAMDDFDRATSTGSRLMLSGSGTEGSDPSRLADLRTWAAAQSGRLSAVRDGLPAESRPEAAEAIRLLDRVLARAEALRATSGCAAETGTVDDLGPVPGKCSADAPDDPSAVKQSGTPEAPSGTPSDTGTPSSAPESSTTDSQESSTRETAGETSESATGDARSSSPERSSGTSSTSSTGSSTPEPESKPGGLLPRITIPPLLPGLGPVTLG